eukprot:scaffold21752_cov30-Prasinocladus_malaysianus.AAC.1
MRPSKPELNATGYAMFCGISRDRYFINRWTDEQVTILFCSIQHLRLIRTDLPEEAAKCIDAVSHCARQLLEKHRGYECEERDGSFMLAFHTAESAMLWALNLQVKGQLGSEY